jgi:hypothetical protein
LRYAIDKKPSYYKSINITKSDVNTFKALHPSASEIKAQTSKIYSTEYINGQEEIHDWREIIYQMAKDFYAYGLMDEFATKIIEANGELYPNGKTGYE